MTVNKQHEDHRPPVEELELSTAEDVAREVIRELFHMPFAAGLGFSNTRKPADAIVRLRQLAAVLRIEGERLNTMERELTQLRADVAGLGRILRLANELGS